MNKQNMAVNTRDLPGFDVPLKTVCGLAAARAEHYAFVATPAGAREADRMFALLRRVGCWPRTVAGAIRLAEEMESAA
jgi:hypothetical protein